MLKSHLCDHCGYVDTIVDNTKGSHFHQPGHSLADQRSTILEQAKKNSFNTKI